MLIRRFFSLVLAVVLLSSTTAFAKDIPIPFTGNPCDQAADAYKKADVAADKDLELQKISYDKIKAIFEQGRALMGDKHTDDMIASLTKPTKRSLAAEKLAMDTACAAQSSKKLDAVRKEQEEAIRAFAQFKAKYTFACLQPTSKNDVPGFRGVCDDLDIDAEKPEGGPAVSGTLIPAVVGTKQ